MTERELSINLMCLSVSAPRDIFKHLRANKASVGVDIILYASKYLDAEIQYDDAGEHSAAQLLVFHL